jgi:2'-5' RNA ligase
LPASRAEPTLVVAATLAEPWQSHFDALRTAHFPSGRNRVPAHVILLHKLPGDLLDLVAQEIITCIIRLSPSVRLSGIRLLGRGVAVALDAPGLTTLHAHLADAFAPHVTPQDRQRYTPHVTVQNKVDAASARSLASALDASFVPVEARVAAVAIWHYQPDGTWQLASRLPWPG